ncbi:MAG: Brp/Blh family beta-carotene 15,15'-monooxygenase [Psychroserpens sp.]|jgi:Brp/Blh family beta-carotene 15,15'-monooxygenase|uniref:Brp/Blh family beta-carotene 15,15'-dioxygenase n=1 Tax=Psychroserpens sp. TaxID=2020870 RepID=UPI0039E404A8
MGKIHNLSILLSFVGLWVTSIFSGEIEIFMGFILIFSFGILHGANDILLIDSISNSKAKYSFLKVLGIYLLTVSAAVIVFYLIPLFAVFLFVLFSAFHFGEQHWEHKRLDVSNKLRNCFYFIYGLLVLQILFILNTSEVIEIITSITSYTVTYAVVLYSFISNLIAFALISILLYYKSSQFKIVFLKELFHLLIFTIIFKVSTLIWGFTIYFIFWHSIPSLYEQINYIYGDFNKGNMFSYLKKAFPYWIISLIGISIVYLIFKDEKLFYAIFFSFLAAITFPHALVINKMFANKKTQPN